MTVHVDGAAEFPAEARIIKRVAGNIMKQFFWSGVDVGFRLMGEAEVSVLNRVFRGQTYATDVLSFPSDDPAYAGDVALCVPVAIKQANALKHPLSVELAVLTVHALAHLGGLDHEEGADAALMQCEVEMGWLAAIRVPPQAALTRRGM